MTRTAHTDSLCAAISPRPLRSQLRAYCTRPAGHDGDHMATIGPAADGGLVLAQWADGATTMIEPDYEAVSADVFYAAPTAEFYTAVRAAAIAAGMLPADVERTVNEARQHGARRALVYEPTAIPPRDDWPQRVRQLEAEVRWLREAVQELARIVGRRQELDACQELDARLAGGWRAQPGNPER